ncbi:hypothetical protein DPEC_G00234080 [Dallia pectoralis]|uniref:Uncharacterized protein n=1 Tax=Dallia pectoralis TaxID=75939 RepID=A0ACC2FY58_DALPE|nr:hypothetical protein DPEC_G00234080 [Dallia pectoralis]
MRPGTSRHHPPPSTRPRIPSPLSCLWHRPTLRDGRTAALRERRSREHYCVAGCLVRCVHPPHKASCDLMCVPPFLHFRHSLSSVSHPALSRSLSLPRWFLKAQVLTGISKPCQGCSSYSQASFPSGPEVCGEGAG